VDKYRNQMIDPRKVAADLNVDTLLTGTFIKDGDDLRITTQLDRTRFCGRMRSISSTTSC